MDVRVKSKALVYPNSARGIQEKTEKQNKEQLGYTVGRQLKAG